MSCLPYRFQEVAKNVPSDTKPFISEKINTILIEYLVLGASYSANVLEVNDPKGVLYAPHCVASRVIAWSVAMAGGLTYDGADGMIFKAQHSTSEVQFAV